MTSKSLHNNYGLDEKMECACGDKRKLETALKAVKRLEYVISTLRTSLLRLKNRRDWKDVEEVDAYIDKMLSLE